MYSKKYVSGFGFGFVKTTYNLECGAVWPICHAERVSLWCVFNCCCYFIPSRLPCGWLQAGKEERNRGGGTPTAGGGRINSVRPAGRRKRKTAASNSIPWRWPCCCWASSSASSPWPSPRGQRSSGPSATSRAARRGRRGTQRQSPYTRRRRSSSDRVFCGC